LTTGAKLVHLALTRCKKPVNQSQCQFRCDRRRHFNRARLQTRLMRSKADVSWNLLENSGWNGQGRSTHTDMMRMSEQLHPKLRIRTSSSASTAISAHPFFSDKFTYYRIFKICRQGQTLRCTACASAIADSYSVFVWHSQVIISPISRLSLAPRANSQIRKREGKSGIYSCARVGGPRSEETMAWEETMTRMRG